MYFRKRPKNREMKPMTRPRKIPRNKKQRKRNAARKTAKPKTSKSKTALNNLVDTNDGCCKSLLLELIWLFINNKFWHCNLDLLFFIRQHVYQ